MPEQILDTHQWQPFPHSDSAFEYTLPALQKAWPRLHQGDCEPWPSEDSILALEPDHPTPKETAIALREGWQAYHAGRFAEAVDRAQAIGLLAHALANKASGIYADYLEEDDAKQRDIYQRGMARAEEAKEAYPNDANAHYFHAFMTGRYSQCISVAKALKDGLVGQVRADVVRTIELAPKHAEAHVALGLFHAEVISKVGKMVAALTHGANAEDALAAFDQALKLTPHAAIAWIEYGNALELIFGDKRIDESNEAYITASQQTPKDAMETLDVEYARASLA